MQVTNFSHLELFTVSRLTKKDCVLNCFRRHRESETEQATIRLSRIANVFSCNNRKVPYIVKHTGTFDPGLRLIRQK